MWEGVGSYGALLKTVCSRQPGGSELPPLSELELAMALHR